MKNIFFEVCKKNLLYIAGLILAVVLIVYLQLVPPQILKRIVDDYLSLNIYDGILGLAVLYLAATVFSYIAEFLRTVLSTYLGQKIILRIRFGMSDKLLRLSVSYYNRHSTGDIMSRFTQDVDAVQTLFTGGIVTMGIDLFKIIGIMISIFLISSELFVYSLCAIPIIIVITEAFRRIILSLQKTYRMYIGKMNSFLQETLTGLKLFKIYGIEHKLDEAFTPLADEQIAVVRKINRIDKAFPAIMQIIRAVFICGFIILSTKEINIITGITVGGLAAAIDLLGRVFAPIEEIANEFQAVQQVMAALSRIGEFLDEPEEERETGQAAAEESSENIILKNVSFSYDGSEKILNRISAEIKKGSKTALVGRTGAGKTTMMNLIAGLYDAPCGSVLVNGLNPFLLAPGERRRLIGIVPQTMVMFTGKIRDCLTLGDTRITLADCICAAKTVGLYETIEALPDKFDTIIGEGEINLSYGEMQLLNLARAIVTNPPILLLDELTAGLDAVTEAKVLAAVQKISENRTIVTISHRLSGIINADYVYILTGGRIVEEGRPEALAGDGGWYAKYSRLESMGWRE